MSWATPPTAVTGAIITAADANTVRDDLNETAPAKVTTAGDLVQGTGANAIARLAAATLGNVLMAQGVGVAVAYAPAVVVGFATGSLATSDHTTWQDITNVTVNITPSVAVGRLVAIGGCHLSSDDSGRLRVVIGASEGAQINGGSNATPVAAHVVANAGATPVTCKLQGQWNGGTGTDTFGDAWIIAIWLPSP